MRLLAFFGAALLVVLAIGALPSEAQTSRKFYMPLLARDATPTPSPSPTPSAVRIRYRAYVENDGWLPWQDESGIAGTIDQGKRLEAFQAEIVSGPPGARVRYRAHVGGTGWQDWVSNGQTAGTTGEQKPIEALQLGLENASGTFISTESYADEWGWLGFVRDFWVSGTTGQARRIQAFRAYVRRGGPEPARIKVAYNVNVQDRGWMGWKRNGEDAGTTGEQARLEAMRVMLYNAPEGMGIEYRINTQGEWRDWVRNGEQGGTVGESKPIYSLEFRLQSPYSGTILSYGAHFQNRGWLEYAADNPSKSNPVLGEPNDQFRLEAMRIGIGNARD